MKSIMDQEQTYSSEDRMVTWVNNNNNKKKPKIAPETASSAEKYAK